MAECVPRGHKVMEPEILPRAIEPIQYHCHTHSPEALLYVLIVGEDNPEMTQPKFASHRFAYNRILHRVEEEAQKRYWALASKFGAISRLTPRPPKVSGLDLPVPEEEPEDRSQGLMAAIGSVPSATLWPLKYRWSK